jgi:uroporphyrinogen-III synthase
MDDARPTLLLTRPLVQSERFAAQCRDVLGVGVKSVISPILGIQRRSVKIDLDGISGIVVTSENGVRALADGADVTGMTAFCVGDRTAETAEKMGMAAISAGGVVEDLIEMVLRARPEGQLFYARGESARGGVAEVLGREGIKVRSQILYDQVPLDLTAEAVELLNRDGEVIVPLFSPRSAAFLSKAAEGAKARLTLVAIGPNVAEAWDGPDPASMAIARTPEADSVLDLVATIYTGKLA